MTEEMPRAARPSTFLCKPLPFPFIEPKADSALLQIDLDLLGALAPVYAPRFVTRPPLTSNE